MNTKLIFRALVTTILVPGSVAGLVPYLILRGSPSIESVPHSAASVIAIFGGLIGIAALLYCIWGFALHGKGTLAPIDPPKVLVVRGLYRYTRNPMYLAVLLTLASEALLFRDFSLLVYAAIAFGCFHLFVRLYEEPHLRSVFGTSYEDYCSRVPRWRIKFRANRVEEGS